MSLSKNTHTICAFTHLKTLTQKSPILLCLYIPSHMHHPNDKTQFVKISLHTPVSPCHLCCFGLKAFGQRVVPPDVPLTSHERYVILGAGPEF